ncbi:MAG: hypothetical protein U9Q71_00685 [Pseudomonadota bacterium]|nr:hypothetical protein [Pseudomonadota bacterium]
MPRNAPSIVECFPHDRNRVIELQARDAAVVELCQDYERVIGALDSPGAKESDLPEQARQDRQYLLVLKQELEQEMAQRLAGVGKTLIES